MLRAVLPNASGAKRPQNSSKDACKDACFEGAERPNIGSKDACSEGARTSGVNASGGFEGQMLQAQMLRAPSALKTALKAARTDCNPFLEVYSGFESNAAARICCR